MRRSDFGQKCYKPFKGCEFKKSTKRAVELYEHSNTRSVLKKPVENSTEISLK